jgi:hypothetical protein
MELRRGAAQSGVNNDPVHCFPAIELSKFSWVAGFQTPSVAILRLR